ncbi:MAG: SO2930 family diheme c-type cytochrome [Pseudomonadota bacterium]
MRALALLLCLLPGLALAVNDAAIMAKKPAKLLSAYGLFEDMATQAPAIGVTPYSLATPLFSDHAEKLRFVYAPGPAVWSQDDVLEFPVGTVLAKTFAYPEGDGLRLIETRLLIRQEAGWKAWPYLWNDDQTDAVLKLAGARLNLTATKPDGTQVAVSYRAPNANQCKGCHELGGAITPIGPKARNLNHDFDYEEGPFNQIARWRMIGLLENHDDPAPPSADWRDGTLDARARAYLDVNCAHCHRREGPASNSGLFLTYGEEERAAWGYLKRPVAAGRGSGGLEFDIKPGDPMSSIFVYRMKSLDPGVMMPELSRSLPDEAGIALIEAWIAAME